MKGLLPIDFSKMLLANAQPLYSYQPCDDIDAFQSLGRNELKKLLGIDIIEAGYVEKDIETVSFVEDFIFENIKVSIKENGEYSICFYRDSFFSFENLKIIKYDGIVY